MNAKTADKGGLFPITDEEEEMIVPSRICLENKVTGKGTGDHAADDWTVAVLMRGTVQENHSIEGGIPGRVGLWRFMRPSERMVNGQLCLQFEDTIFTCPDRKTFLDAG